MVRHAESNANALNTHGGAESELSDNGIKQARSVAKRFAQTDADVILCSKYRRAVQTAKIINEVVGRKIIYNEVLGEWRYPSELRGKISGNDAEKKIWDAIDRNWSNPKWHYSDEENISEVKKRAEKALKFLKSRKEDSLIVIIHGAFMGVMLGLILFGNEMTGEQLRRSRRFFLMKNTAITELEIRDDESVRLATFNDYTHL